MAARRAASSSPSSRLGACLLLILTNIVAVRVAVTAEATSLLGAANCGSIDACRAGVANDACCKAINAAIDQGTCACACKQLAIFGHVNLAGACGQKAGCPRCRNCHCSKLISDEPASSM